MSQVISANVLNLSLCEVVLQVRWERRRSILVRIQAQPHEDVETLRYDLVVM